LSFPTTVARVCQIHGITAQAYYQKRRRERAASPGEAEVLAAVGSVRQKQPKIGGRKLYVMLMGMLRRLRIGRDKFFALLRRHKLLIRRRRPRVWTTDSRHSYRRYRNCIKGKRPWRAAEIYQSDITYLRVGDDFAYASLVTDAFSRKIVGWSLEKTLAATGPIKALHRALRERGRRKRPLIHHSDQGVQYCCERYVKILKKCLATISMSKKGAPYENAIAERVNGILKHEYGLVDRFKTFRQARVALREAIHLYNNERPHLALGYQKPAEVHRQSLNQLN